MLTQLVVWLNTIANISAAALLAPLAFLPGWLSATIVAAITGVLMLLIYKYTSNQSAIQRVRSDIKANLLALSLFKENVGVSLRSQGRLLFGVVRLLAHSLRPMLVMIIPVSLLLAQLALWYQARPLHVGEDAIITVHLKHDERDSLSKVQLASATGFDATIGPVRVPAKQMICWTIQATSAGSHRMSFTIDGKTFDKELVVGDGFMPTSLERPNWDWYAALWNPRERPFAVTSPVQSIEVLYPARLSWVTGSQTWIWYWFAVSLAVAFLARPLFKVNF